jgi:hypothetical protein
MLAPVLVITAMGLTQAWLSFAVTAVEAVTWWRTGFTAVALVGVYLTFIGEIPRRIRTIDVSA